jgi:hypothetical protein
MNAQMVSAADSILMSLPVSASAASNGPAIADLTGNIVAPVMNRLSRQLTLVSIILLGLASSGHALSYKYAAINFPSASASFPIAISSDGHLVLATTELNRPFIYNTQSQLYVKLDIPIPSATSITVSGINSSAAVVGGYHDGSGDHGYYYRGGHVQTIDFPGAASTTGTAINDQGTVVGTYVDGAQVEHSFVKRGGKFTSFDFPETTNCYGEGGVFRQVFAVGINKSDEILGTSGRNCEIGGISILDDHGVFSILDIGIEVFTGMNNRNQIVGTSYGGIPSGQLAVYENGTITNPAGPGSFNFGTGIDSKGDIVGWYEDALINGVFSLNGGFLGRPIR